MAKNKNKFDETVVTFKSENRVVAMYFSEKEDGDLDMQMSIEPKIEEGEEPDGPLALASVFLKALNVDVDDPKIYNGQD